MFARTTIAALSIVILLANPPGSIAGPVFDVEVRLVPTTAPSGSNQLPGDDAYFTSRWNPGLGRYFEPVDSQPFSVEIWVSDNNGANTPNTGIIAAYLDVSWHPPDAPVNASGLTHTPKFDLFPAGTIDNPNNRVINFGGSDGTFTGQGVEPTFARVGSIEFTPKPKDEIDMLVFFDGMIGAGEIGVLNRSVGPVHIVGGAVPEPAALALLAVGLLAVFRRR